MFYWFSIFCVLVVLFLVVLVLAEPGLKYEVQAPPHALDSPEYLCLMGALTDTQVLGHSHIEVLTDAGAFYEAQLEAIRGAQRSINLEAYIFRRSQIAQRFLDALTERARAGVKVKLVLDAIGNLTTPNSFFQTLCAAGGQVRWYQPIRWYTFKRLNNRTHRELLIVDGEMGFIGGAGVADWWVSGDGRSPAWRDTVCRVTGQLVAGLQTTFADNWLESSEQILMGEDYYPMCSKPSSARGGGESAGMVVISTPSAARSTRSRVLFQVLLASARKTIHINSPYFVPDRGMCRELVRAARDRGVKVSVVTPGQYNNHGIARLASRRRYGLLLEAGVEIFEYQPSMIHAKVMVVDGIWSVVGSTNFDNRSFGLNDEVNLGAVSAELATRLREDFDRDVAQSKRITIDDWRRRSMGEKCLALILSVLDRQA